MRIVIALAFCSLALPGISQDSTSTGGVTTTSLPNETHYPTWIFQAPRVINANSVQLIPKGNLEFGITHTFGDAAGDFGGLKNFFGIDDAQDIRIGFQYGLSKHLNIAAARYKGATKVQRMYEIGLKWLIAEQRDNDPSHPLALAFYANAVVATMHSGTNPDFENFVHGFSDRLSNDYQLMLARRFGKNFSFQLSPTLIHRNFTLPYDEKSLFALGGATRIHLHGRFSLLLDYFHTFRSQSTIDSFKVRATKFYDALGAGLEIVTEGHVFHLNFTNTKDILENRFIPSTTSSWGKGQFRWSFTIARNFDLLYKKRNKQKKNNSE